MKLRTEKLPYYLLIIISIISIIFIYIEMSAKIKVYAPCYTDKKEATILAQMLFEKIKEERLSKNLLIDPINDPNATGLIGIQYSLITTERGDLDAKLTTTNPNFAALIVELLKGIGLKEGDVIAISFSSSFPALNIEVLAVTEILKLKPIIITSVSSSMWGANVPDFTYLDMERYLYDLRLISNRSSCASIGGVDDVGRGMGPEGRFLTMKIIERNGVRLIEAKSLEEAIVKRMKIYSEMANGRSIKAFINVGGGAAALGGIEVPSGIVDKEFMKNKGLIGEFLRTQIPVINLTDINHLAQIHDLPIAPIPLPRIGKGKLFYEIRYSTLLASIFAGILLVILFVVLRFDVDYYIKKLFSEEGIKRQ